MNKNPKVVIVGAGFGGIALAKSLRNKKVDVVVIDRNNYHNFQPLMYQVATGGLDADSIAYPVRRIFRKAANISFRMAEVLNIDLQKQHLETSTGILEYDYLVIATGSQTNFYNFDSSKDALFSLKSLSEALNLRSYIFQNLEKALMPVEGETVEEIISIAIIGGGPAGIELAGAFAEMKRYVFPRDFPELDLTKMKIHLYEASSRLLSAMSDQASEKSLQYLQALGVDVFLNAKVESYDGSIVKLADGSVFVTDTVIWTAGVKGAPIPGLPAEKMLAGERISVNEFNQVIDSDNVFAIGDVASCVSTESPRGLPMLATVAQQQGTATGLNIVRLVNKQPLEKFHYNNRGVMATIGRNKAVVDLPNFKFQGVFAWFVWMFIHIMSLVGFRNRAIAFFDWSSNYVNYDRPLGLIIRPFKRKSDL